jgi:hypothetical protein
MENKPGELYDRQTCKYETNTCRSVNISVSVIYYLYIGQYLCICHILSLYLLISLYLSYIIFISVNIVVPVNIFLSVNIFVLVGIMYADILYVRYCTVCIRLGFVIFLFIFRVTYLYHFLWNKIFCIQCSILHYDFTVFIMCLFNKQESITVRSTTLLVDFPTIFLCLMSRLI